MDYWHYLAIGSLFFVLLERLMPWHEPHRTFRPGWLRDLCYLAVNGHLFSFYTMVFSAALYAKVIALLQGWGFQAEAAVAVGWPLWVQFIAFLFLSDFIQWCTHVSLHKVPFLWAFHKVHHSIPHLDWAANFHYHWMENVVYALTRALPWAWLGADPTAMFWVFVVGTYWGHFNHSNVPLRIGPMRYLFNSPHMHIWHHDASDEGGTSKNYGIVLSVWDWLFGTAYWPQDREPERLGYPGDAEMPQHLTGQLVWPIRLNFASRLVGVLARLVRGH